MYKKITSPSRIEDYELPRTLQFGETSYTIPKILRKKVPHYLYSPEGKLVRAAWISKVLGHILNSTTLDSPAAKEELQRAINELDLEIWGLIRRALKGRGRKGVMAFSQTHEKVPPDCVMVSERTFNAMCNSKKRWEKVETVYVERFPNLGPATTVELQLLVNTKPFYEKEDTGYSIESRLPGLRELLNFSEEEETLEDNIVECLYLNGETLRGCLEGDSDGDIIYMVPAKRGKPLFRSESLVREPGEISEKDIDKMLLKADRVNRGNLSDWLSQMFDEVPIAKATYTIHWDHFKSLPDHQDHSNPSHKAWAINSPRYIRRVETIFDIRKGDFTEEQILAELEAIDAGMSEIAEAQANGSWFAKTVTSNTLDDVEGFIGRFPTLNSYLKHICGRE